MLVPQLPIPDALRSSKWLLCIQYCRHLQCDECDLEHCCSQRRSIISCSHIAAESWARYIRRRKCVVCVDVSYCGGCCVGRDGDVRVGGGVIVPQLLIPDALRRYKQQYCI